MSTIVLKTAAILACLVAPVGAEDWTTSYASLGRTSYLAREAVVPPFALEWEYMSPEPLKGAPLVALNRAYLSDAQLHVWSLNLPDGTLSWKHDEARDPREVRCYDALTGVLKWVQTVDGNLIHTPQVSQTVVYVSSSAGILYAFNQTDGKPLWKAAVGMPLTLPAADLGLVVVGSGSALIGVNPADGRQAFRADLGGPLTGVPVVAEDGAYAATSESVVAVDRGGRERWRARLKSPAWASLSVTKGGVLAGCVDGTVRLLGRENGAQKWEVLLAGTPNVVAGAGDVVYAGTRQGTLVGMRLLDGAKLWSASLGHGPVDGMALSAGKLVVIAGKWVGTLLPAPEAPENLSVKSNGGQAELVWDAAKVNGSPISAYRIFRHRGGNAAQTAVVPAGLTGFKQDILAGGAGYQVVAVGANGAESVKSLEVTLAKGEPLVARLAAVPVPYDPRSGLLSVTFGLRDGARVVWSVVDAEGRQVTDERSVVLPRGACAVSWDGADRAGKPVEPGIYRVQIKAAAGGEEEACARAFPVAWAYDGGAGALAGAGGQEAVRPAGGGTAGATAGGSSSGSGGSADAGTGSGNSGSSGGGSDSTGKHDNGVRDHGTGSGRDGAGQDKGQGGSQGNK